MAREKGKKYTPTSGFLAERGPRDLRPPLVEGHPGLILPRQGARRMWMSAPSWKRDRTPNELAALIREETPHETVVFCDTSLFRYPLDFSVWDALLERRIFITPLVWAELHPWLAHPSSNQQIRDLVQHARRRGCSHVEFVEINHKYTDHAFQHYFDLLCYRRRLGAAIRRKLRTQLQTAPSHQELHEECQRQLGVRGGKLALKGWLDRRKPNRFTDEQLVVLAIQTAILRRRDLLILTRDLDLEEQFFKFVGFLDHDYRAMLVAADYARRPHVYDLTPRVVWAGMGAYEGCYHSCHLPLSHTEGLVPAGSAMIKLNCLVLAGDLPTLKITPQVYHAESGMAQLLRTKTITGGLNTDQLDGMNCRLGYVKRTAVVAPVVLREQLVPLGKSRVSAIDKMYARSVDEQVVDVQQL
ncbi:MAG: hypothetical protein ACYSWU_19280 [Planctomycetota bacterium]|jgi:hypothetical protein